MKASQKWQPTQEGFEKLANNSGRLRKKATTTGRYLNKSQLLYQNFAKMATNTGRLRKWQPTQYGFL